jgi:hypothetical protein
MSGDVRITVTQIQRIIGAYRAQGFCSYLSRFLNGLISFVDYLTTVV